MISMEDEMKRLGKRAGSEDVHNANARHRFPLAAINRALYLPSPTLFRSTRTADPGSLDRAPFAPSESSPRISSQMRYESAFESLRSFD